MKKTIILKDRIHLKDTISKEMARYGLSCDLNHLDIFQWNVSNVTEMYYMFSQSHFNNNLDDWRPYKLEKKDDMFTESPALIPYWYTH